MPSSLPESILRLAARTGILPRGSRVLVAVSGGQDSCALFHSLDAIRDELGIELHAAHLNHGFRGEDADGDAEFVRDLADSLGVPCTVEKQDVPAIAKRLHLSKQEAARRARHEFLDRTADAAGADSIALAHTRDDRIETVLMNILRGTGVDGLAGLTPRNGRRIRPLLDVSREETAAYCRENGIAFREDASNLSTAYTRNRIRAELLPALESSYNPAVRDAILRLADLAAQDSAALHEISLDGFERCTVNSSDSSVVLSVERLMELPVAIRRRVVREAIAAVRGDLYDVDAAAIERTLANLNGEGPRFQFVLPNGDISVEVTGDALRVAKKGPVCAVRRFERALDVPGSVLMPEFAAEFRARLARLPREGKAGAAASIYVRESELSPPLVVRNRRPGDRIRPAGLGGSKKIQDILTDAKVPAYKRDHVPIVADDRGILWVPGHVVDERCLRGSAGENVVVIEIISEPGA